jgi:3-methyladenine DNA glycosylase AlkD
MGPLVEGLNRALERAGDPERAINEKAYLKSPIDHYGASVPAVRKAVAEAVRAHGSLSRRTLLSVVRRLWRSSVHEQRMAAVVLLAAHQDLLEAEDLHLVEGMIRGSFTWAYVDTLAASVAGAVVERHPELASELDRWATDECFWIRRGAMLALMGPLRTGEGDWRRFKRYADAMLDEKEFFIRKAIGWVLRETSKKRPDRVRKYVDARLDRMSGVTFREAVRRLPEDERDRLVARYRGRGR